MAVGIPLLLLGGCAAVGLVLFYSSKDRVVTEADSPVARMPSKQPEANQPPATEPAQQQPQEQLKQESSTATVGGSITLQGTDPGLQVPVTVNQLVNPANPAQDFMKPKTGNKIVAVQVTLANVGRAVYSDAPTNGALLIDGEGQQYRSSFHDVREGQSLSGMVTINTGDSRKGMIVFEVPEGAKSAKLQFALNSGFADQKREWTLS
ncbi:DUF4352 domain-containing protein [Nonomuraea sp. NPDC049784]|uniref:DUF4352 domain-containing protein n=1 Tax=Nonomuraea sp. NPDC049784 TaxID=3154361 RepID=UPI0033EAEB21